MEYRACFRLFWTENDIFYNDLLLKTIFPRLLWKYIKDIWLTHQIMCTMFKLLLFITFQLSQMPRTHQDQYFPLALSLTFPLKSKDGENGKFKVKVEAENISPNKYKS